MPILCYQYCAVIGSTSLGSFASVASSTCCVSAFLIMALPLMMMMMMVVVVVVVVTKATTYGAKRGLSHVDFHLNARTHAHTRTGTLTSRDRHRINNNTRHTRDIPVRCDVIRCDVTSPRAQRCAERGNFDPLSRCPILLSGSMSIE